MTQDSPSIDDDWEDDDWEDDASYREPPPRRSRWRTVGLVVGVVTLASLAFVGLVALYSFTARELPVGENDRTVIVDASDLVEWIDGFTPNPDAEIFRRLRYIDGVIDIDYEYSDELDENAPWFTCTATYERTSRDARTSYGAVWLGYVGSFKVDGDTTVVERDDLFRWGDSSHFAILRDADGPYGNLFVARKGKLVFDFCISGVYFDEAGDAKDLLRAVLTRASVYSVR